MWGKDGHGTGASLRPLFEVGSRPHAGRTGNVLEDIMEIRERQFGHVVCIDVEGRLVLDMEDRLKDKVNSLLFQGQRDIILNLKDVSQIDTTGLAALTAVRRAADGNRGTIKLLNLPPRIYDLLVLTRLITLFEVFDSEAEAVSSFARIAG